MGFLKAKLYFEAGPRNTKTPESILVAESVITFLGSNGKKVFTNIDLKAVFGENASHIMLDKAIKADK